MGLPHGEPADGRPSATESAVNRSQSQEARYRRVKRASDAEDHALTVLRARQFLADFPDAAYGWYLLGVARESRWHATRRAEHTLAKAIEVLSSGQTADAVRRDGLTVQVRWRLRAGGGVVSKGDRQLPERYGRLRLPGGPSGEAGPASGGRGDSPSGDALHGGGPRRGFPQLGVCLTRPRAVRSGRGVLPRSDPPRPELPGGEALCET